MPSFPLFRPQRSQTALSLVFLIGGIIVLVGVTLSYLVISFTNASFGFQAANRALTTARYIARETNYPAAAIVLSESLYMGTVEGILVLVRQTDASHRILMVVSHNPSVTAFSNFLSGDTIERMPTCAIACMEFDTDDWKSLGRGTGRTIYYEYPKKHFR